MAIMKVKDLNGDALDYAIAINNGWKWIGGKKISCRKEELVIGESYSPSKNIAQSGEFIRCVYEMYNSSDSVKIIPFVGETIQHKKMEVALCQAFLENIFIKEIEIPEEFL